MVSQQSPCCSTQGGLSSLGGRAGADEKQNSREKKAASERGEVGNGWGCPELLAYSCGTEEENSHVPELCTRESSNVS